MHLSAATHEKIRAEIAHYPNPRGALLYALHVARDEAGALGKELFAEVGEYFGMRAGEVAASQGAMKGVLGYTEDKVVSTDFRGEPMTSVFDADAGIALDKTFVKVVAWYDNEWGYSNKVLEMARVIAR